jgi:protein-L-isoaspartate(D-aspartate) O-methyltransferase
MGHLFEQFGKVHGVSERTLGQCPRDLVRACCAAGVRDERVLEAVARVPRAGFVPAEHAAAAYLDEPVPIAHHQVTTQPSLLARMVEALALTGRERVLEVGAGLGWQTALLAQLAAEVFAVERFADLARDAQANIERHRVAGAYVVVGDGSVGLAEHAPYDAIVVSAAFPAVPSPLVEQLVVRGQLVQPIGTGGAEDVLLFRKEDSGRLQCIRRVSQARFVRLYGRHGYSERPTSGDKTDP